MMIVKNNSFLNYNPINPILNLCNQNHESSKSSNEGKKKSAFCWQGRGTGMGIGSCWDSTKNCGVRGRDLRKCTIRRGSACRRSISRKHRNMKLLILITVACNSTGEEQIPIGSDVEKRVAIFHGQDWILEVAAVIRFFCNLNHWILAWWVQEHCRPPWKSEMEA